jgi:type I restriction-modification system DNA methylase subunit
VPPEARWDDLLANANQSDIGSRLDRALEGIERENPELRGVLPRIYARAPLPPAKLGELLTTIAKVGFGDSGEEARDILGRTYEYFIKTFARHEGHRGGEFYTPASVTKLLVEMLEPFNGRVYEPAFGSAGLFIQSGRFVEEHGTQARVEVELRDGPATVLRSLSAEPGYGFLTLLPHGEDGGEEEWIVPVAAVARITLRQAEEREPVGFSLPAA